jgi:hypothetical protein
VPFAWYQRSNAWNSAMPIASPEPASYIEPLPQLPPRMPVIGVGLPLAAPFATLTDVGVLSLCPAMSATCPGQDCPGIVTLRSSSCQIRVGNTWSFAVMKRPSGPMCAASAFVISWANQR